MQNTLKIELNAKCQAHRVRFLPQWHSFEYHCIDKFVKHFYCSIVLTQYIWKFFVNLSYLDQCRQKCTLPFISHAPPPTPTPTSTPPPTDILIQNWRWKRYITALLASIFYLPIFLILCKTQQRPTIIWKFCMSRTRNWQIGTHIIVHHLKINLSHPG